VFHTDCIQVADLGEARRDVWVGGEAFFTAQADFFTQTAVPPVPGWESADAAQARFVTAMNRILSDHPPTESVAVVSHATVLTLYTAHLRGSAPSYREWSEIPFAAIMAVDRETLSPVTSFLSPPYEGLPLPR
jgi:broad specificity phosphatase PhoE